ncbi:MAG: hypothetical protein HQL46_05000 [Gammaproteobacteria bacterium]|nr:hypothetical protein [Gammaproteobacteria bacterium]
MDNFQIVQRSRFQFLYWWLFIAVLLGLTYVLGFTLGQKNEQKSNIDKEQLNKELAQQQLEISELIEDKVILKQELSLKEKTLGVLESNYKQLLKENKNLKEDINFFQRIMKPQEKNLELAIHKIHLYPALSTKENNQWLNKLMSDKSKEVYDMNALLVNYAMQKKLLKGHLNIDLYDNNQKLLKNVVWYNDNGQVVTKLSVKFKYYQQISYYAVVDADTEITSVKLDVIIRNSKNKIEEIMMKQNEAGEFKYVGQ